MNPQKCFASAILTVLSATSIYAQSFTLDPLWSLAPGGDRAYLSSTDGSQRGLAYNPVSNEVLLVSRVGTTAVYRLSGDGGADLGTLNVTGISGGTFGLNIISVAADGAIYGSNLTTDTIGAPGVLKIYRWANASAAPTLAYSGDPSNGDATLANRRFGDNMDVRGSGTGTEILLASRSGTVVTILGTADGINFTSTKISTDITAGDLGLGVSFGTGNTFWGTASGRPVRELSYSGTTATTSSGCRFAD
jgi:hypothetical protein